MKSNETALVKCIGMPLRSGKLGTVLRLRSLNIFFFRSKGQIVVTYVSSSAAIFFHMKYYVKVDLYKNYDR